MSIEQKVKDFKIRFNSFDYTLFYRFGLTPEIVNQFDDRFNSREIIDLYEKNISSITANMFDKRFRAYQIIKLLKLGITPETANRYNQRFNRFEIFELAHAGVNPDSAENYDINLSGVQIAELAKPSNVTSSNYPTTSIDNKEHKHITIEFDSDKRFLVMELEILAMEKIKITKARKYKERFSTSDIVEFNYLGIEPDIANIYPDNFSAEDILRIDATGINSLGLTNEQIKKYRYIFKKLAKTNLGYEHRLRYKSFISTGSSSIIFLDNNHKTAWKYSRNIKHEVGLINKITGKFPDQNNIIKISEEPMFNLIVGLEYIHGKTLTSIICSKKLDDKTIIDYTSQIMEGLINIRKSGVYYHRDIRPDNILIENGTNRVVIIDLGIATTDRHALPIPNRRYMSPDGFLANDLISLGQVMYFMSTGKHLFDDSESMSLTFSKQADEINDARNKAYADPSGHSLALYLNKAYDTIENKKIRDLTMRLLTSKSYEYKKMWKMFKEYAK